MKTFDAHATREALPFDRLIPALAQGFREGCEVPRRHVHELASGDESLVSLLMPAWIPGRCYGVKIVNVAPGNSARGLPGLHSTYTLFDARTGAPLASLDGDEITARRTVAASALAARFVARPNARHLVIVGAGRLAGLLPLAYREVLPIERVTIWARSSARAQGTVDALRAQGVDVSLTEDLESAVRSADVVSCATLATEPLVQGGWLSPGAHLDLIGSFTPAMREADDDCFRDAALYIDTEEALQKSGDLLGPLSRGVITPGDVQATLERLCRQGVATPGHDGRRTVFKSVGTALEDLTAAVLAFEGR